MYHTKKPWDSPHSLVLQMFCGGYAVKYRAGERIRMGEVISVQAHFWRLMRLQYELKGKERDIEDKEEKKRGKEQRVHPYMHFLYFSRCQHNPVPLLKVLSALNFVIRHLKITWQCVSGYICDFCVGPIVYLIDLPNIS